MSDDAKSEINPISTRSDTDADEWLQRMRHSAAHVLAQVVLKEFPDAKYAIGPPIDTGFYYDFLLPRALTPRDLEVFQNAMKKELKRKSAFVWSSVSIAQARDQFSEQPFKLELINDLAAENSTVGVCKHADFTDLCRGGHVSHTGEIGPFKLTNIAGAYWRGDENQPQLQRVYGALFETKSALKEHFVRIEEANRRDHRKIGKEMGLFTFSDDVGSGLPLFLPKGEIIRHTMDRIM